MEQTICSIYDEKAKAFLTPFIAPTVAHAMRTFGDAVNDDKTAFEKHPADYTLFVIATFDVDTGEVLPGKSALGNGAEFRQAQIPVQAVNQ